MTLRDATLIKDEIINFLRIKGPSFPVQIAKQIGMDTLFASAFLSELMSDKKVFSSNMKVGASSIYFLPGQEEGLESFSIYIKGKELEAKNLLKESKFLVDIEQEPAIKVALRNLKDFAKTFEKDGKIIWRYFNQNEEDYNKNEEIKKEEVEKVKEEKQKGEPEIKEKIGEKPKKIKLQKKLTKNKKIPKKDDEMFFNKIKIYLSEQGFEILDIVSFNKKDLILKIKKNGEEKLAVSYNKKRISEKDILYAHKKSESLKMNYIVISLGETPKKILSWIEALKTMESIESIE